MNSNEKEERQKNRRFYAIVAVSLVAFFIISIEIASFLILVVLKQNFYLPLALRDRDQIERMARADVLLASNDFSQELGWEPRFSNPHGYRGPQKDVENAAIAVFGDSFTLGYSPIEKSWPNLLETALERPVLNFGVGGYGVDQAYWRFKKRYLGKIHTPYVALAIMSENIARNLSLYRGFYNRRANLAATKPRYHLETDGRIVHMDNPLGSREELPKLSELDFLRAVGENDYWYQYFEKFGLNEMVGFPYSYYFLKALPYYISRFYTRRIEENAPYKNLYADEEATQILTFIIEQFIEDARADGSIPIILFLPNWMDMNDVVHKNKKAPYANFFEETKNRHPATFDAMSYFLPYFSRGEPISDFFQSRMDGHYNARGDRVLSEGFYRDLMVLDEKHSLLAPHPASRERPGGSEAMSPKTNQYGHIRGPSPRSEFSPHRPERFPMPGRRWLVRTASLPSTARD